MVRRAAESSGSWRATSGERYYSLNRYLKERFGGRLAKIPLDAGFGCPNRDGSLGSGGCVFCGRRGSGTGAREKGLSISAQIEAVRAYLSRRYKTDRFIAYFQAFSNTHGPVEALEQAYDQALAFDQVKVLAVGTRPDCLEKEKLDLLGRINREREVWLELGLQSAHDSTLKRINRGHDFQAFRRAVEAAAGRGLKVFVHLILGLPGEGFKEAAETVDLLRPLKLTGVKLHGLHVSTDAPLAQDYRAGRVRLLTLEEYAGMVAGLIGLMPPEWIIQRLTGDPYPQTLLGPVWMRDKPKVLAAIRDRLEELDIWQGRDLGSECRK